MFTAAWFKDTLERVVKTGLQVFFATLILSGVYQHLTTKRAIVLAAIAAGFAALKCVVAVAIPANVSPASFASGARRYVVDIVERLIFSFIEGFAAYMLTDYHLSGLHSAVAAGVAAALSFVMSLLSLSVPSPISPASLIPGPVATATPTPRV